LFRRQTSITEKRGQKRRHHAKGGIERGIENGEFREWRDLSHPGDPYHAGQPNTIAAARGAASRTACKRAVCGPEEDFSPAFRKNDEPTTGIDRQCIGDTEPSEGISMPMQRGNYKFEAEDEKVYAAWLRRTLVAYGVLVLISISVVTIHATRRPNFFLPRSKPSASIG
jgi:hypothetical protein